MKHDKELYLDNEIFGCDEDFERKSEKVVKCRKEHKCPHCDKVITKGDYAVCESGFYFGEPVSYYSCIPCMESWMEEIGAVDCEDNNEE